VPRLARLEIEGYGLIERAAIAFAPGCTVFTGETGSGKTMLVGALAFVLGARTSADVVRGGSQRTRVTLELDDLDPAVRERFAADGFELDPDEGAILTRELSSVGKSSARINGRPATTAQLRAYGEAFVDFIGQHEQQRLLSPAYQLDALDRFAGEAAAARRTEVGSAHARVQALERELRELETSEGRALAEVEFANFALAEIDAANPSAGEDAELRERRDFLANVERIAATLAQAHALLVESDGAAVEALGSAAALVGQLARYGASLGAAAARIVALQEETTDLAAALALELERAEFDPRELAAIGERLDLLERLKKKYGGSLPAVIAARDGFAAAIERFASRDEMLAKLREQNAEAAGARDAAARQLSILRAEAARKLEAELARELDALAMRAARFTVALEPLEACGPRGTERVEFLLAPNPGEPARPLAKAASGGELSRVLLALVAALADRRERSTLVFDEIDAGVGGATAVAVAVRIGALARTSQLVCVTHLAQIAGWGDRHYALRKFGDDEQTTIDIVPLESPQSVEDEIARMLSGSTSEVARRHAATLLGDIGRRKHQKLSA
jgi:DNA repair protein RecN (Recombination protein N)